MTRLPSATDELKVWQRFHIRLSAMYGGLVLAVLLTISYVFYARGVDRELSALQAKLRIAAMSLAATIPPSDIAVLRVAADDQQPAYKRIASQFLAVSKAEPDFSDLYIMRRTSTGGIEVVVDVVIIADAPSAKVGDPYEPAPGTRLLEGFAGPVVETDVYTDAWGTVLSGYAPILEADGTATSLVGIDVRASRLAALKREVGLVVLVVLASAVGVLSLLALVVARSVRKPLAQIVDATNAIASGKLHVRAQLRRQDEFGVVGRHFDDMAHGLEEREFIKATFGQYVSPEVVKRMLTERSEAVRGQRRHAAVMFVDLRKFTTLSESMSPEEVVSLLNEYLERMTNVITRHGGRIDKFIGDAILADWGTLDDEPRPEEKAVAAALGMLRELAAWNATRKENNQAPLDIGIAIHAGAVVAGTIGSSRKLEFTIIGDAVNVASRLEGLCKLFGARLVVSGAVVSGNDANTRWLDTMVLRGRREPTEIYEVLDPDDPRCASLETYARAAQLLRAGEHAEAYAAFMALRALGADPVVEHQLQRASGQVG
ncbi:MAG: adenylate/guanylate cyclase domain-containing protein [Kofleriaceae bacterium]|nr:adenylate/guanylate cyclase domain-containing protein [Kofleriaceae bacterium]